MTNKPDPNPDPSWTHDEIKKLWNNCSSRLSAIAYAITKDKEAAKDIVMKNFLKVLEGRSGISPNENPCDQLSVWVSNDSKTHLTAKVRSENRNEIFQAKYNPEVDPGVESLIIHAENLQRLREEIEKLPPECNKVIKLVREGLDFKEIAIRLNKKESTVRSNKSRGLKILKKRLGGTDLFPLLTILI